MQSHPFLSAIASAILISCIVPVASGQAPQTPQVIPPVIKVTTGFDDSTVFVRFLPNAKGSEKAAARRSVNASLLRSSKRVAGLEHIGLAKAPGMTVERAVRILNKLPFVDYAHPNYRIGINQVPPDDEHFVEQWSLHNTGQASTYGVFLGGVADADIDWLESRDLATGAGVVVAVMDTGIDYRHSDIAPNVWLNEAELNGVAGVDDDNNGYIDDVRGWDFFNNDPFPLDGHGHGTHVAGTIAAVTGNAKGVAGIMPDGKVMALKILSDLGEGYLSDAVEALEYALDKGVRISNNSWGYSEILPQEIADHNALHDAIQTAQGAGHLFVAAAGNDSIDTDVAPHYPSSFALDNIISVGATDNLDELAWFSSFGAVSVDLAAPGDVIMSTYVLFAGQFDDYSWLSGTSMATPHVSGVAGLIMGLQPDWSYTQVKNRILATTRPLAVLAGKNVTGGVLNMYNAIDGLPLALSVDIDVEPNDPDNYVETEGAYSDKVFVAVLTTSVSDGDATDFDAATVDESTVRFGPASATPFDPVGAITDVDGDGDNDLRMRFRIADTGITCDYTEDVVLAGSTTGGQAFEGSDTVTTPVCPSCHP
jgi:subtilisin family serine protease